VGAGAGESIVLAVVTYLMLRFAFELRI